MCTTQRQSRQQLVTSLVVAFGPENKKETFSLDIKANHWGEAPGGYTQMVGCSYHRPQS
jgi:hypothetical protein